MGVKTKIAWTRSSWNPWLGCTEVSPGCDACYARELDARHKWGGATHWGPGVPRHRTGASSWQHPLQWNRIARLEQQTGKVVAQSEWKGKPGFYPVFPSLCDPFDNEVPAEWHGDFWRLIRATPNLTWLLLTKRIGNVEKMHPGSEYPNVWIGASIVNQSEADRDIPKLLATPAAKRFVSYEPALDAVDFTQACAQYRWTDRDGVTCCGMLRNLDQVIIGGESNQGAHKGRPFDIGWARSTIRQCKAAGVAVFVKQLGAHALPERLYGTVMRNRLPLTDRAGADAAEWYEDLRVQEFPV